MVEIPLLDERAEGNVILQSDDANGWSERKVAGLCNAGSIRSEVPVLVLRVNFELQMAKDIHVNAAAIGQQYGAVSRVTGDRSELEVQGSNSNQGVCVRMQAMREGYSARNPPR